MPKLSDMCSKKPFENMKQAKPAKPQPKQKQKERK